jgi:muconolactone delta-isomerase
MKFMVHAKFRLQDQKEILARLPQEQARLKELKDQGIVEALYIGSDLSQVWIALQGETQDDAQKGLASLPLYPYMEVETTLLSEM